MRKSVRVAASVLSVIAAASGIGAARAADDLVVAVDLVAKTGRPSNTVDAIAKRFGQLFANLPRMTGLNVMASNNATRAWLSFEASADLNMTLDAVRARLASALPADLEDSGPPLVRWQRGKIRDGTGPVTPIIELIATVDVPGASPESIDRDITKPIATRLAALPGVSRFRSNSSYGRSQTFIQLNLLWDEDGSERAVRQALLDARRDFPAGALAPAIFRTERPLDH